MLILGLNAFSRDAAAALVQDGRVLAAVEEERLSRVKHAGGFPARAIRACLEAAEVRLEDVTHLAVAHRPERNMTGSILFALGGRSSFSDAYRAALEEAAQPVLWKELVAQAAGVDPARLRCEVHPVEHAHAHAASAFYGSPYDEAAVLVVDTVGDYVSTSLGRGRGASIEALEKVLFPHSLGLFYGMLSQLCGFEGTGDESRTMGLSALGTPRLLDAVRGLVKGARGSAFELDLDAFRHAKDGEPVRPVESVPRSPTLFSEKAVERFGRPRHRDEPITDRERDLAFAAQRVLEERLVDLAQRVQKATGAKELVYAGQVAMNCVANRALRKAGIFEEIALAPVPGDSGTAIGAALETAVRLGAPREKIAVARQRTDLGPGYAKERAEGALLARGLEARRPENLVEETAQALARGELVGWFDGRMEFGARALGHRSVLADPRNPKASERLRGTLSHRETYRSFGASVPLLSSGTFFADAAPSPFMLDAFEVRREWAAKLPCIVHADGTTRLQTVAREAHPRYHALLEAFGAKTGVPVLLNTSFNADEPIVCTPEEAVSCALRSGLDRLVMDGFSARLRKGGAGETDARGEIAGTGSQSGSIDGLMAGARA